MDHSILLQKLEFYGLGLRRWHGLNHILLVENRKL